MREHQGAGRQMPSPYVEYHRALYGRPPTREDSWTRPKRYGEKWPRFCAEVPPELADELDAHIKRLRLQHGRATGNRAQVVRAALRLYLNSEVPERPPSIDSEAVELESEAGEKSHD